MPDILLYCTVHTAQDVLDHKAKAKAEFQKRYDLAQGPQYELVVFLGEFVGGGWLGG